MKGRSVKSCINSYESLYSILIIDNDPDWLDIIENALNRERIYRINRAKDRKSALQLLGKHTYDLVITNFLLRESFSGSWIADITSVLDEIAEKQNRVILITGAHELDISAANTIFHLRKKYNEIIHVLSKTGTPTYEIRDVVKKALKRDVENGGNGGSLREELAELDSSFGEDWRLDFDSVPYNLDEGVHRDIYSGIVEHLNEIFSGIDSYKGKLWAVLSKPQDDTSYSYAADLWINLWNQENGLPSFDMIHLLAKKEYGGDLYKGYRDHVVHSLLIYLLGLYIYFSNQKIQQAMKTIGTEGEFLKAWKIAALFHDIGYHLSGSGQPTTEVQELLIDQLNLFMRNPLTSYGIAHQIFNINETDEAQSRRVAGNLPSWELRNFQDLRKPFAPLVDGHILDQLDDLVEDANLADHNKRCYCSRYDNYARNVDQASYSRSDDHGMISAMILLGQHTYFQRYVDVICKTDILKSITGLPDKERGLMEQLPARVKEYAHVVRQAAAAIALHNVHVTGWDKYDRGWSIAKSDPYFLTLDRYKLSLEKTPLAWLLALTDVLQCWDRPNRTEAPLALRECTMKHQQIQIKVSATKIVLTFTTDEFKGLSSSRFRKLVDEIGKYLGDLDILEEGSL